MQKLDYNFELLANSLKIRQGRIVIDIANEVPEPLIKLNLIK